MNWSTVALICLGVVILVNVLIIVVTWILTYLTNREIRRCAKAIRSRRENEAMWRSDK